MKKLQADHSSAPSSPMQSGCKSHGRHDSKLSTATAHSARAKHQEYISQLKPPSLDTMNRIAQVQEQKEAQTTQRRLSSDRNAMDDAQRCKAASLIQQSYRGYRDRRQLEGLGLDPSTRWVEAIKEARYRNLTAPRPKSSNSACFESEKERRALAARQQWKKVGIITRRAGADEEGRSETSHEDEDSGLSEEQKMDKRRKRMKQNATRQKSAKIMDLQYFLEMVDVRHRYGSNLRTYHQEWKKADTTENFFYWLDYGEGRFVDCAGCARQRLDRECVRYLSKEERLHYLVKIDDEGRLCWAKSGVRIDTTEKYKDSIHGIVPVDDPTPAYEPTNLAAEPDAGNTNFAHGESSPITPTSESDFSRDPDEELEPAAVKHTNDKLQSSSGIKKVKHVSAATVFNKLLRSSVKKNTWIFVADTLFHLYVGIKQSGAFQHSSFLHGSRISAAGLIKIKNGRLSKLSPLSGHYRPPVSNFRSFVHSLKDGGVDMSHVSISRSYAVLAGLEAYSKTRRKGKRVLGQLIHGRDKIFNPETAKKREVEAMDTSESAAIERKFLEREAGRARREATERREERVVSGGLMEKLGLGLRAS